METIHNMQSSQRKEVSGLKPFKNPKIRRRGSRGLRSGGSLALPANPPPPRHHSPSHPPLLPLPRVNNSNNFSSALPYVQTKAEFVGNKPSLTRTGSVPVWYNHTQSDFDFTKGLNDGYPGPVIMLLSPPPSCLPMPRFTIKPKINCHVEAAWKNDVVDTDNIRRVLQLR
ncbi:unnamed protein product [Cochlearia groenlandica]